MNVGEIKDGVKYDDGKLRTDLVPLEMLEYIAEVYTYGADKYPANTWQQVEPHRYWAALLRHLIKYNKGGHLDIESGLPHLKHALWNIAVLCYLMDKKEHE